jgi:hypothetical protein
MISEGFRASACNLDPPQWGDKPTNVAVNKLQVRLQNLYDRIDDKC